MVFTFTTEQPTEIKKMSALPHWRNTLYKNFLTPLSPCSVRAGFHIITLIWCRELSTCTKYMPGFFIMLTICASSCTLDFSVSAYAQVSIILQSFPSTHCYISTEKSILEVQSKLLIAFGLLCWKTTLPGGILQFFVKFWTLRHPSGSYMYFGHQKKPRSILLFIN